MDVGENQDVLLQRACSSYLAELQSALPKFLFKRTDSGRVKARASVRVSTTSRILKLLDPFQEWPQLLDPHLQTIVGSLAEALLQVSNQNSLREHLRPAEGQLVIRLDQAICRILYTLCKTRGSKVVSRLLNNEAEILESILEKVESAALADDARESPNDGFGVSWEEKYCLTLWLSHLLFTPFPLATVGSTEPAKLPLPSDLQLPVGLPPIASRLIGVSVKYIGAAGKERESAVKLLSRLAARPDMLKLSLYTGLIEWSLSSLTQITSATESASPYESIGFLSLLGSLASALDASVLEPLLLRILDGVMHLASAPRSIPSVVTSSAVARKAVIKLFRVLTLAALQLSNSEISEQALESVIDYLLNSLADNDTPVRQAASKALSAIAVRLPSDMTAEIVEAVVDGLQENVLRVQGVGMTNASSNRRDEAAKKVRFRDYSAVNPLRWHGLVLTLSQLLFQKSAPASQLHAISNALLLALQFEKRTATGTSLGGNVRDAANFGIWSIARKYSTEELKYVEAPLVDTKTFLEETKSPSTIQTIAGELVVAACLDLSGNIRRGSSAALQELIGRHPDTITEGINLVQTVDYHAVALRSRAVCDVALEVAKLDKLYWFQLADAMFGWRCLAAADASVRRVAAKAIGALSIAYMPESFTTMISILRWQVGGLMKSDIEGRHGLFLAAAELAQTAGKFNLEAQALSRLWDILRPNLLFEDKHLVSSMTRPELTAEAVSAVIKTFFAASSPEKDVMVQPSSETLEACYVYVDLALQRREDIVISSASQAAAEIFQRSSSNTQTRLVTTWTNAARASMGAGGATVNCHGYLAALSSTYMLSEAKEETPSSKQVKDTFVEMLQRGSRVDIDTKVAALKGMKDGIIGRIKLLDFEVIQVLEVSLQDYTIDQRGDIGSLARLEAIAGVERAIKRGLITDSSKHLVALVATLAAEKLDRVRFAAWNCLQECQNLLDPVDLKANAFKTAGQTSSAQYYSKLLSLLQIDWLKTPLLQGLSISIGAGSESVLRVSRYALSKYCIEATGPRLQNLATELLSLLRNNLEQDRLVLPLLETWAYLFQAQHVTSLEANSEFSFKRLFVLVQKAHFKSGNAQKLNAAIEVYCGLAAIKNIEADVVLKLRTLLFHPLAQVRNNAAEALYRTTGQKELLPIDWSKPPKELKKLWSAI